MVINKISNLVLNNNNLSYFILGLFLHEFVFMREFWEPFKLVRDVEIKIILFVSLYHINKVKLREVPVPFKPYQHIHSNTRHVFHTKNEQHFFDLMK